MKKICVLLIALGVASWTLASTKTATLSVKGWTCGSCASSTRIALKKLDGVENVKTDFEKMEAVVTYDDSKVTPEKIVQASEKIGYTTTVRTVVDSPPIAASSGPTGGPANEGAAQPTLGPEDVSFFEVPLECGAAANLGCGSAAKPLLRELERDPRVASAKINRPGTLLAVAWKDANQAPSGIPFVESTFEKNERAVELLRRTDREKALQRYKAEQWYGAADVNRLSEHEAEVIASRLVTRSRLGLGVDAQAALTRDLSAVFAKHLTSDSPGDRAIVEEELVTAAGKHLSPSQLAELRKAGEQGVYALPGESR